MAAEISIPHQLPAALEPAHGIGPEILDWATAHTPDDAEAVAIGAIEALEAALGRPVVSANQATFWQALRASSLEDRLFEIGLPGS